MSSRKRFALKLINGEKLYTIQKWRLRADEKYTIGRSDKAQIRLDEQSVSRQHAEISVFDESATIKDLGSANGTFIEQAPQKPNKLVFLEAGMRIHLGDSNNFFLVQAKRSRTVHQLKEAEDQQKQLQLQQEPPYYNHQQIQFHHNHMQEQQEQQQKQQQQLQQQQQQQQKLHHDSKNSHSHHHRQREQQLLLQQHEHHNRICFQMEPAKEKKRKTVDFSEEVLRKYHKRSPSVEKRAEEDKHSHLQHETRRPSADSLMTPFKCGSGIFDAREKRKLLWQNKEPENLLGKAQIYGQVQASSEETDKFFKLMGFKQVEGGKSVSVGAQNFSIKKSGESQETMIRDLEAQFNEGVKRKNGGKGGIGTY